MSLSWITDDHEISKDRQSDQATTTTNSSNSEDENPDDLRMTINKINQKMLEIKETKIEEGNRFKKIKNFKIHSILSK